MSAKYRSSTPGTREFMNSQMISKAMRGVADDMLAQVQREAKGGYESRSRTVQGGKYATNRAGAEVSETARHWSERTPGAWSDAKRYRLVNMSRTYTMRGGG